MLHKSISHKAPYEQRERYKHLLYLRCVDENKHAPPLPQRPGYQDAKKAFSSFAKAIKTRLGNSFSSHKVKGRAHIISMILHCKDTLSGKAPIGKNISQKSVLSQPPFLAAGHQVHPGGARLHGLRAGVRTIGKTVSVLKSGEIRQHRLAFLMKSIQASGNWSARLQTTSQELSPSTKKHDRSLDFFSGFRVQTAATALNATGRCRRHTCMYTRMRTCFLVERVTFHSSALCMGQGVLW